MGRHPPLRPAHAGLSRLPGGMSRAPGRAPVGSPAGPGRARSVTVWLVYRLTRALTGEDDASPVAGGAPALVDTADRRTPEPPSLLDRDVGPAALGGGVRADHAGVALGLAVLWNEATRRRHRGRVGRAPGRIRSRHRQRRGDPGAAVVGPVRTGHAGALGLDLARSHVRVPGRVLAAAGSRASDRAWPRRRDGPVVGEQRRSLRAVCAHGPLDGSQPVRRAEPARHGRQRHELPGRGPRLWPLDELDQDAELTAGRWGLSGSQPWPHPRAGRRQAGALLEPLAQCGRDSLAGR